MASLITTWKSLDGDPTSAGSWTNGVPDGTMIARFDSTSQKNVTGGLALICRRLEVTEDYDGCMGGMGTPVLLTLHENAVLHGSGDMYFDWQDPGAPSPWWLVDMADERAKVWIDGTIYRLFVKSGDVTVAGTADVYFGIYATSPAARVTCDYGCDIGYDGLSVGPCVVTIEDGATFINNGTINYVNYNVLGGTAYESGVFNSDSVAVGAYILYDVITIRGGTMVYTPVTAPDSTWAPMWKLLSGTLDLSLSLYEVYGTQVTIGEDMDIIGLIRSVGAVVGAYPVDLRNPWPEYQGP